MYFQSFYLSCLSHASYMIASGGEAAVVDPQRDVEIYLDEATRQNLLIKYVIESHLHADFVSGHHELAARTGATICISDQARAQFPHQAIHDGEILTLGNCRLQFLATPGHTPESMCIVLTDLEKSQKPWAVLTGDTLFIGDVGRPDLSPEFSPPQLAAMLYDSLHSKLLSLEDGVEVYPAHGAGSLCGRNISSDRSSTIGKERQFNYALQPMSREDFVHMLTSELPERPAYFARDAEINRAGADQMEALPPLPPFSPGQVEALTSGAQATAVLLDTRPWSDFAAAHIPGSVHIALSGQFASWAGTLLGLDRPIVLLAEDPEKIEESRMRLARVGIERVQGFLDGGIAAWQQSGRATSPAAQISVVELNRMLAAGEEIQVIDVRRLSEWNSGHIASAHLLTLGKFEPVIAQNPAAMNEMFAGLDRSRPVAVHCKGGYRSAIATSLLERAGFTAVANILGGFDAWQAQNLPVRESTPAAPAAAGTTARI